MPIEPTKPRHTFEDQGDRVIIVIRTRQQVLYTLFLLWYLLGSVPGIIQIVTDTYQKGELLHAMIYCGIPLLPFNLILLLLLGWQFFGEEIIEVSDSSIILNKTILDVGFPKEYSAIYISDFRVAISFKEFENSGISRIGRSFGINGGCMAFDYGASSIRFGVSVDEAEAKQIYAEIVQKYPQYGPKATQPDGNAVPSESGSNFPTHLINYQADYLEFQCDDPARFEKLVKVFIALRDAKTKGPFPGNTFWLEFFDEDAKKFFWWPTNQELQEWKHCWDATPEYLRLTEASLQRPWLFESMIESIKDGDYELLSCFLMGVNRGRLEYMPYPGESGGSDALKVLIECFGMRIL